MDETGSHFNLRVNKVTLVLFAGLVWIGVGFMLCKMAIGWLNDYASGGKYIFAVTGIMAALVIHHFGFLKVVNKNLTRLNSFEGKRCPFSFISWRSYMLVAIMMTMGITMRHSSIPKQYLSVLYLAIGLALVLSSIRYFRHYLHEIFINI
jgi:hypothetical protein